MRKEEKLLAKITGALVNQCCSCRREFICTGQCSFIFGCHQTQRRIGLCYCKKCLLAPEMGVLKLTIEYVEKRKNCYLD